MPMMALVHPVYDCLMRLAQPDALQNEDEVCLPTIPCFTRLPSGPRRSFITSCSCVTCLPSVTQVDCLVLQLHRIGDQLEKVNSERMDELFFLLRDGFLLQNGLSSLARLLLLEILEFRAGNWRLGEAAQKYYYSEVHE